MTPSRRSRRVGPGWQFAAGTRAGRPRGFLRFWRLYERLSLAAVRPQPIPDAPSGIFLVRLTRHHGPGVMLPDGMRIAPGDTVAELHLHNARVPDLATRGGAFTLLRMMAGDLGALAAWIERSAAGEPAANVRAVVGLTLLGRGASRLGFTVRERPHTLKAWLDRLFMTGLLALYSPQGLARLARGSTYGTYPTEVWMSRTTLLRRYGSTSSAPEGPPSGN